MINISVNVRQKTKEKGMFHIVDTRRHRTISLLGFLFILLVILATVAVNQADLHQAHAASACKGAPAGFDPTAPKVTNAQLEQYGLPARPSARKQPREYAIWLNLVQHAKYRVCVTSRTRGPLAFNGTSTVAPLSMKTGNTEYSGNSSGYIANGSGIGYVSGTWEVPCEQQSYHVSATLDDMISVASSQSSPIFLSVGTQEVHTETNGVGSDKDRYFVYFQGRGFSFGDPLGRPIHCGDAVSAQIMYDNTVKPAQWSAYIGDTVTNSDFAGTYTAGALPNIAKWGEYAPTSPLYTFVTIPWSGSAMANASNQADAKSIAQWPNTPSVLINSTGVQEAAPTTLDSTGAGFTDVWKKTF
jgi:hypothetical protein